MNDFNLLRKISGIDDVEEEAFIIVMLPLGAAYCGTPNLLFTRDAVVGGLIMLLLRPVFIEIGCVRATLILRYLLLARAVFIYIFSNAGGCV